MAQHRGELVVQAVVATLTGLPTTGANVFRMVKYNQPVEVLPSINVVQGEETLLMDDEDGAVWPVADRLFELFLEIRSRHPAGSAAMEAELFQIEQEAVAALRANRKLGFSWVHDTMEEARGELDEENIGDQPIGLIEKTIVVKYRTNIDDPGA